MIELRNDHISVQILPEIGGKISSLFDQRSGREWLWTNPHLPRRAPIYGESYISELDTGGWDEIFPSISPCQLQGNISIPDHGDLVFLPCEVSEQTSNGLTLTTLTRAIKTRFTRKLTLDGNKLRVDYTLDSLSEEPIPYLWAPHPIIALEDGMILELPTSELTSTDGLDLTNASDGSCKITIADPALGKTKPHMLKFFTQRGLADRASIHAKDGSSLSLWWDKKDAPYFGMWLNQRNWSGIGSAPYFNLGLEPTTSPCDCLTEAIANDLHFTLNPGESRKWHLELFLNEATSDEA
jgi:galactose mutarotase-like enzyme